MKGRYALLFSCLLTLSLRTLSQDGFSGPVWREIESGIDKKDNLGTISDRLTLLKRSAIAAHDLPDLAHCLRDQLLLTDKITEDTLFFKNSRFIDSILDDSRTPPLLQSIMYLLKAERINRYISRFFYRNNKNLIGNYDPKINYSALDLPALDSLVNDCFEQAKKIIMIRDTIPVEKLLWLSDDPLVFLFRPDLTDIIYSEQISAKPGYGGQHNAEGLQPWLSLSQDDFIRLPDTAAWFPGPQGAIFRLYKDWIRYHLSSAPGASYFIETLARKYFYESLYSDSTLSVPYQQYLQSLTHSPFTSVQAHGLYQLCLRWNAAARKYNPASGNDYYDRVIGARKFDSAYRPYYNKVLTAIDDHRQLLDSFPAFRHILQTVGTEIISPAFHIMGDDTHLPGAPFLVFLKYRNIRTLHIRVVRIKRDDDSNLLSHYLSLPGYRESAQSLPADNDHQWHNAFLKIDSLPAGHYALVFSDPAADETHPRADFMRITVTNIAVINNDRVFVLNRKTGYPMTGATVVPEYKRRDGTAGPETYAPRKKSKPAGVNAEGYVTISGEGPDRLRVVAAGDTIVLPFHQADNALPDQLFDKDGVDNLLDYYEKNIQLHMFTDRSIYRPGQTVHYKGIFLIRNPRTGESLVLNWKNLQVPLFKKLFYRLNVKFQQKKLEVDIEDPFDKKMDTLLVIPNKYGSFAGDFILPRDAATGEWRFYDENSALDNDGGFKVEEYRRPSFELKLEQPHHELQLGDTFSIVARTRSYAGAALGHVELRYKITAGGSLPRPDAKGSYAIEYRDEPVSIGNEYTNDRGELAINVRDTALLRYQLTDDRKWEMDYSIEVEAIDATGESHSEELNVGLSNRPVRLRLNFASAMDRQQLAPLYIPASSDLAGPVKKKVELRLYRLPAVKMKRPEDEWPPTDISLYTRNDLRNWLGDILPDSNENVTTEDKDNKQLIFRDSLMAGEDKFNWPKELLTSGRYALEVTCREKGKITGSVKKEFSLFDRAANTLPGETASFQSMSVNMVKPGGTIHWITGNTLQDIFSIYHLAYYARTKKGVEIRYGYDIRPEKKGLNEWEYIMPEQAVGTVQLTHLYIFNNQLHKQEQSVFIPDGGRPNPQIVIERYRKKLEPGGKETFQLTVRIGDKRPAAELLTTLYDASLDKLAKHDWQIPNTQNDLAVSNNWENQIVSGAEAKWRIEFSRGNLLNPEQEKSLWWLDPTDYPFIPADRPAGNFDPGGSRILFGRAAGLSILNAEGLDNIVVVGYGTQRRSLTGDFIMIRGEVSIAQYAKMTVILDGLPYTGDLKNLDVNSIVQGIVLKGADATALYGSTAANGVLLLSTKGPVQIPQSDEPPPVTVRRSFAETAFFYGQLHPDRKGVYTIPFTLPESVTEWKWKMLVHTKKALFAYEERTLYSQLPLMVQPDMPRFLYQGDTSLLISRISNLDSADHQGVLQCHIEDAVTGEDLTGKLVASNKENFSVGARSTTNGIFRLAIPPGLLHPLRIKIIASAGNFSDGEEHVLPILAKKIWAIRNMPFVSDHTNNGRITTPALPEDAEPYGIGLYINPQPQAAMVNALPYLADYPYDCAEQTFNKLLAHALAIRIARTDNPALVISREHASSISPASPDAKDQPGFPDETSMPWLRLNNLAATHQAALGRLLDTLSSRRLVEKYFNDLRQMQNGDGGICWFKGGKSDLFISEYLLAGFGKMKKDSLPLPGDPAHRGGLSAKDLSDNKELSDFISALIGYCDNVSAQPQADLPGYLYARSFWTKEFPLTPGPAGRLDDLLHDYWEKDKDRAVDRQIPAPLGTSVSSGTSVTSGTSARFDRSIGFQASMISSTLRYAAPGQPYYQEAIRQLESLRQSAITDTVNGIRWKDVSDPDDLSTQTEEWMVRIAEAFEEDDHSQTTVAGIVKWLLQSRQDHHWGTTKSTADAVSLLNRQRLSVIGHPVSWKISTLPAVLEVSDNLLGGQSFAFSPLSSLFPRELTIQARTSAASTGNSDTSSGEINHSSGGINYYYFSANPNSGTDDPGSTSSTNSPGVKISKTLYRQKEGTEQWEPITPATSLKIADKIRTILTIDAPRQLQYVFIDEKRAAALEPADPESRYVYGEDVEYYRSVRDIGTRFFAEMIPSGISTISYESVVDREGTYLEGPAALQCMYQPSVTAYSKTITLKVMAADPK